MPTLHVALRCLKHPETLLSIGLLLANDHWLKASFPSWWTGKFSDFAGLFFFPFLVASLLGLLVGRKNVSSVSVGRFAFGLSGIWFASFKTVPPVNAATCALLAVLLRHPVQLVLDPTDLVALPVLVPAWLLWMHEARTGEDKTSKRAWLALAVALLATVATSPPPPAFNIRQLEEESGKVYAYGTAGYYGTSGYYVATSPNMLLASSEDVGRTWTSASFPPNALPATSLQASQQACDPGNNQVCYRAGTEQVEASQDGGKTFQTVWSIPWGRRYFMQRENQNTGLAQEKQIDMGPYDLIFMPPVGANGLSTVVFAMGNEGVLVRSPEGIWQRYAVGTATPTPYTSKDAWDAFRIIPLETDIAAFLVLLTFSLLSFRTASTFKRLGGSTHSIGWAIWPLVAVDLLFLIGWGAWVLIGFYRMGPFSVYGALVSSIFAGPFSQTLLGPMLLLVLLSIVLVWVWKRIAQLASDSRMTARAFWRTVFITIGLVLATWGVLLLWDYGIIPVYELAVALAVTLAVVLVIVGIKRVPGEQPPREPAQKVREPLQGE